MWKNTYASKSARFRLLRLRIMEIAVLTMGSGKASIRISIIRSKTAKPSLLV